MNNFKSDSMELASFYLEKILDNKLYTDILRFHQSTKIIGNNSLMNIYSNDIIRWLKIVEGSDVLPNFFIDEYPFKKSNIRNVGSIRQFNDKAINISTLEEVIKKTLSRDSSNKSKRYPSAGGLYPVIVLICLLKDNSKLKRGVYIYDADSNSLKLIHNWGEKEFQRTIESLCPLEKQPYSDFFIAYAIDLKRSIAKYGSRGYRHALIEVGTITQAFKESLIEENDNYAQFLHSGFDDDALTYNLGLSPRECPITIVQWIGQMR